MLNRFSLSPTRLPHLVYRAAQKWSLALTARAFGAHGERKVLAVGNAHRQHLPLLNGLACEAVQEEKTTFAQP